MDVYIIIKVTTLEQQLLHWGIVSRILSLPLYYILLLCGIVSIYSHNHHSMYVKSIDITNDISLGINIMYFGIVNVHAMPYVFVET